MYVLRHAQVDVYSLGCILNECWTRQQPWRDSSHFFQVHAGLSLMTAISANLNWQS